MMSFWARPMEAAKTAVAAPMTATTSRAVGAMRKRRLTPGHHVDAGGHHGGGVDQGADRRGAFHGVGQPGIKGDLGRFAGGPHEEQQGDQGDHPVPHGELSRGGGKDGFEVDGSEGHKDQKDRQQKPVIPDAVDDEGLFAGVGGRLFLVPEADQEIGAEPHPFPADEKEEKVIGGDQNQHEEDEEIQIGEITGIVADRRAYTRGNRYG